MNTAQRFFPLSILGVMALALAPLASANGIGFGASMRGHLRDALANVDSETRVEIKAAFEACREKNADYQEAVMYTCAEAVALQYGFTLPEHGQGKIKGIRARIGHKFRSSIEETCGEREDTEEWRTCAKNTRGEVRSDLKENHPRMFKRMRRHSGSRVSTELRAELKACREQETAEAKRTCILEITTKIRAQMQSQTDPN